MTDIIADCDAAARLTFKGERLTDHDLEYFGSYVDMAPASPWAHELYRRWLEHADCRTLGDLLTRLYGWQP